MNDNQKRAVAVGLVSLLVVAIGLNQMPPSRQGGFDGQRALQDVATQVDFGPRIPGSDAHALEVEWLMAELHHAGWSAQVQQGEYLGQPIRNVVARRGSGQPWVLLGAHYDSRIFADRDEDTAAHGLPVPGANDGASGVAVLLELARVLPESLDAEVWLVFFDAEDNGHIAGWDWIMGSRYFAQNLDSNPDAVVIVDMVGDADLSLPLDGNSDPDLAADIWNAADELGYGNVFQDQVKYHILDDHIPFVERGIPAVDIIDLDYAYWHTRQDTLDKVSAESLQTVGDVLLTWLLDID